MDITDIADCPHNDTECIKDADSGGTYHYYCRDCGARRLHWPMFVDGTSWELPRLVKELIKSQATTSAPESSS